MKVSGETRLMTPAFGAGGGVGGGGSARGEETEEFHVSQHTLSIDQ